MEELEPKQEQTFYKSQYPVSTTSPMAQEVQIKLMSEIYDLIWPDDCIWWQ